jgi:hypothetical protein
MVAAVAGIGPGWSAGKSRKADDGIIAQGRSIAAFNRPSSTAKARKIRTKENCRDNPGMRAKYAAFSTKLGSFCQNVVEEVLCYNAELIAEAHGLLPEIQLSVKFTTCMFTLWRVSGAQGATGKLAP